MKITLDKRFAKKLRGQFETFEFRVGVLKDAQRKEPFDLFGEPVIGSYAGGPVRKTSKDRSTATNAEVLVANMERMNMNILLRPFQEQSSEIIRFTKEFIKSAFATKAPKRLENLLQAIVRNPILNQEYGANKSSTADAKGFNRKLIDTAQMFKSIKAQVKRVGR